MTNRFKELDLIDGVPEELWTDIPNTVQEALIKIIPKKKLKKAKWLSEEALKIAEKRRERQGRKGKIYPSECRVLQNSKRDNKAFLIEQCKEIGGNSTMGKTRDIFKNIRDTKGPFHAKMGTIKDRNGMDLTEAEDIKKRWQKYTELYKKKIFMTK